MMTKHKKIVAAALALAALLLLVGVVHADFGDHVSSEDFNLDSNNDSPDGIAHNGTYFYVVDSADNNFYAYTSDGAAAASENFDLPAGSTDARGAAFGDGKSIGGSPRLACCLTSGGSWR